MNDEEWHKPDTRVRMPDGSICECPKCESTNLVPTGKFVDANEREKEVQCRACGHLF